MRRMLVILALITTIVLAGVYSRSQAVVANRITTDDPIAAADEIMRPEGWTKASHSNDVDPNYVVVFPQDKVNQITITIDPADWEAMQANMIELYGQSWGPGGFGRFGGGQPPAPPTDGRQPEGNPFPQSDGPRGFEGPGGGFGGNRENPMWVDATLEFEGQIWTHVGVRYKGNSSLMSSWRSGSLKLPLKLDFDEFEDDYPEIDNQRFYGFKQLSLANGFGDASFMRETVTYDLLAEANLPAAETAFYEVILDYDEEPVSLGLYTAVEVVDDTVVDRYFGSDDGNIYEGDGQAVSLAEGTFDQIEDSFQKENNEDEADWSDIEELYHVLHAEARIIDPDAWRADLESVFDVDTFLEWLAISAVIQHWDTYGGMSHNFYLYHNPDTDQLTWISWDHNLVLGDSMGGPGGRGGGPGGRTGSLDRTNTRDNWPLISYLLADPVYQEAYRNYLAETSALFNPDELAAKYQALAGVIAPYAAEDVGQETFASAVQSLTDRAYERAQVLADFLADP